MLLVSWYWTLQSSHGECVILYIDADYKYSLGDRKNLEPVIFEDDRLLRVTRREVFDVAADIQKSSPQFGRWVGVLLSEKNTQQLWEPEGTACESLIIYVADLAGRDFRNAIDSARIRDELDIVC